MTRLILTVVILLTLWTPATASVKANRDCVTYKQTLCARITMPDARGRVRFQLWQPGWMTDPARRKYSWWCETTSPFNPRVGMRCIKSRWQ